MKANHFEPVLRPNHQRSVADPAFIICLNRVSFICLYTCFCVAKCLIIFWSIHSSNNLFQEPILIGSCLFETRIVMNEFDHHIA